VTSPPRPLPRWVPRNPRLVLVAVHVPIIAEAPLYTILGDVGYPATRSPWLAVLFGLMILVLQLRHSLAMARGERPRGGVWTLLALAVLAYVPLIWFGVNWISAAFPLVASAPMVLRGRLAAPVVAGPYVYLAVVVAQRIAADPTAANYFFQIVYFAGSTAIVPATLYASARLVRVVDDLRATQAALAQAAVGQERLRVSRDLHDLLGHSLSAISLKGDVAVRLLRRDAAAAVAEIENLGEVARDALRGLRGIAADGGRPSLDGELDNARALLASAGLTVRVDAETAGIAPEADEVLAWVVREGVTNVLRHAVPASVTIEVQRRDGAVRLDIVNDGARPPEAADGHGLRGLAGRVEELSGTLSHGWTGDGRFRLTAQVPVTGVEETSWIASGCSSPKTSA
jgi:two-component system, NarL family, sensor histidine kinase DesK